MSRSARALAEVLDEGGEEAVAIKAAIHRTMLWRFAAGKRKPEAETLAKMHQLSGGRVAADGWTDEEDEPAPRKRAQLLPAAGTRG
jgi:hypothetical protein